jgi:hypothetical protein
MAEVVGSRGPCQSNAGLRKRSIVRAYEGEASMRKLRWGPNSWESSQRWIAESALDMC